MAEIEYAEKLNQEMSNILVTHGVLYTPDDKIPQQETFTERLAHQYYDTVTIQLRLQIENMSRLHAGHILAEKVFSQIDTDNVISLVQHMLIYQKHHVELRKLHHMFSNVYWKDRLRCVNKLCPTWDVITIPDSIGLIQFTQLCLRRINILQRKSPVVELDMDCVVYKGKSSGSFDS